MTDSFALDTPSKCSVRVYFHSAPKSFTMRKKTTAATIENDVEQNNVSIHFHYKLSIREANAFLQHDSKWWWIMTCAHVFFHVSYKIYELKSTTTKNRRKITRKRAYPCDFQWKSKEKNRPGWEWCKNVVSKIIWKWKRHRKVDEILFIRRPIWILFGKWCWFT